MLPFSYLLLPLCYHFHRNNSPIRQIAKQWFWRTAFGIEDFRRANEVYDYCTDFFDKLDQGKKPVIQQLILSKTKLMQASYNSQSALSRTVLSFLAKQNPLDFSDPDSEVLDSVYLLLSQAPNLHHIYPQNFLQDIKGLPNDVEIDSLMNICYLRAKTNIKIRDKNPLHYFQEFSNVDNFDRILDSHLIPKEFTKKEEFKPEDYKEFLYARAELFCQKIKDELPDVDVKIVD